MQRLLIALVAVSLLIVPAAPARAWNDRGHMIVALVTYRRLGVEQRDRVDKLLRAHPHYKLFLTQYLPAGVSAEEWAFARAATWPDFVRRPAFTGEFHRSKWHYVNIPFTPAKEAPLLEGPKFEAPRPNAIFAVEENLDVLTEKSTSDVRKAMALAWLMHLVGDMHQPLHCTALVTRAYPAGDRGGNSLAVRSGKKMLNLHSYWDGALGDDREFDSIDKVATALLADPPLPAAELSELSKEVTPQAWADEGYHLAREYVYLNGELPIADFDAAKSGALAAAAVPTLSDDYEKAAQALALKRATLAGHRLANILNAQLAPP